MPLEQMISNIVTVIIMLGGPIFPLLVLAAEIGRWHADNPDPDSLLEPERGQH